MKPLSRAAVVIVSGGLDSTVLAYHLREEGYVLAQLLSFNYGQRHAKELVSAANTSAVLAAPWRMIDLTSLKPLLEGSSLTDSHVEVPEGHYAAESMKATVVPNRNAMMLSIAYAVAIAQKAHTVAFGAHAGDHDIYPDCRMEFVAALENALRKGNEWANPIPKVVAPFHNVSKAAIVSRGAELKVPFAKTWSCYNGGDIHCGRCGTCVERREAFQLAGVEDPTTYAVPWEETEALLVR